MCVLENTRNVEVRDLVALVGQAVMRLAFHVAVLERTPDRTIDRTDGETCLQRFDRAIGCERRLEARGRLRAITVAAHILRPIPGELHRAADILRDQDRLA